MGEAARKALLRRTTGGQRIDMCIRMSDEYLCHYLEKVPIPQDASPGERARIQFQAIRKLKNRRCKRTDGKSRSASKKKGSHSWSSGRSHRQTSPKSDACISLHDLVSLNDV